MFIFPKKEISEISVICKNEKRKFWGIFGILKTLENTEISENALVGATKISKTLQNFWNFRNSLFRKSEHCCFFERILGQTDARVRTVQKRIWQSVSATNLFFEYCFTSNTVLRGWLMNLRKLKAPLVSRIWTFHVPHHCPFSNFLSLFSNFRFDHFG